MRLPIFRYYVLIIFLFICFLLSSISASKIFKSETEFQLKLLESISLGCDFYFFLADGFTVHHENLVNHIHLHMKRSAIYQSLILPIGLRLDSIVRNNLTDKLQIHDPNSYHFHTLRHLEVSKCSFNVLSSVKKSSADYDWRKLKNHVWFNECFGRNPCYHFTISIDNSIDSADIAESVNTAVNLFHQISPIQHFILVDNKVLRVCSSSTLETQPVLHNNDDKYDRYIFPTSPCSSPRVIRFSNFDYIAPNFKDMFETFRSQDRKIFKTCSTTEVFWHYQLALKLNATLRIVNVTAPPELIETLFNNLADISLGFPYNPGNARISGFSSQPIALDQFIFFTRLPTSVPAAMDFLIKPYASLVWIGILTSIVISGAFTFTVTSLQFMKKTNYLAHVRWPIVLLIEQSQTFDSQVFKRSGVRLLVGLWLCSGIVFSTMYKGKLISILLNPELDMPPRTFEQLLGHPEYVIVSPGYPNRSGLQTDLKSSGTPTAKILVDRIQGLFSDESLLDCLFDIRQPGIACIGAKYYYTNLYKARTQDRSESYMQSMDAILSVAAHISVQKNSPFQEPLDKIVSHLIDAGIGMDFWNRIVSDFSDFFRYDTRLTEYYKPQTITNTHNKPLIVITTVLQYVRLKSIALTFAFVVFALEILIHRHRKNSLTFINEFVT